MQNTAKRGLSRRDFLAAAAMSAASLAAFAGMSGCSSPEAGSDAAPSEAATPAPGFDVEIFDTDLLIVGGGQGAIAACWSALSDGGNVMVVEKAPIHHGGPTSWSWSCYSRIILGNGDDLWKVTNQPLRKNIANYFNKEYVNGTNNKAVYQINRGQLLSQRTPEGDVDALGATRLYFNQFFKYELDALVHSHSVQVVDNTMVTDFLVNDGVCYGAMGIHIPSGKFRVFRAKATIMATGAPAWMYGWVNTKAATLNGTDNTGELQAALYRRGVGLAEAEITSYDFYNYYPRIAYGSVTGCDAVIAQQVTDKNGDLAFPNGFSDPDAFNVNHGLHHSWAKVLDAGLGGPMNGLYMGCEIEGGEGWLRQNVVDAQKKFLGVDLTTGTVECITELFDKGGQPITDDRMMTEITGLFDLHAAGTGVQTACGDNIGNSSQIKTNGAYVGHCAVQFIKSEYEEVEEIDWQPALDEFNRLHELRTRKVEGGIRPNVIREKIQVLTREFMDVLRSSDRCERALAELDRIREEDLPKMCCVDQAVNWNKEWRDAIETLALYDMSYISAQATLFREETGRFQYYNSDFPELDPAWDNCYTLCRMVDGERTISKETYPTL